MTRAASTLLVSTIRILYIITSGPYTLEDFMVYTFLLFPLTLFELDTMSY